MKRIRIFSSVLFAGSVFAGVTLPAAASVYDDAKTVCLERFNDEQKSGSVPKGMNKARYLRQCQTSYVRSVQLEDKLNNVSSKPAITGIDGSNALSKDGQGGPEILPPARVAKTAKNTAHLPPLPRFKPVQ